MSLKIISQKENPLLKRKEIEFISESMSNPKKNEIEELVSKEFSTAPENVHVKKITGNFGSTSFHILVHVYGSADEKTKTESRSKKKKEAKK